MTLKTGQIGRQCILINLGAPPPRTEIIIKATRTREVLGEQGRRIRDCRARWKEVRNPVLGTFQRSALGLRRTCCRGVLG